MKKRLLSLSSVLCLAWAAGAVPAAAPRAAVDDLHGPQTVTLYAPRDKRTGRYSESRAWFSFESGTSGSADTQTSADRWDLGFGFLAINDEDFFSVSLGSNDKRSVIRDMGARDWMEGFEVPVLAPLPALEPGQARTISVDASAGKLDRWERTNGIFARAVAGHMYLVHIKDDDSDFYALFRVETLAPGESCTISWRRIPSPERE